MRISDWSSDVCSSDLRVHLLGDDVGRIAERSREDLGELENRSRDLAEAVPLRDRAGALDDRPESARLLGQKVAGTADRLQVRQCRGPSGGARSEEHTSELQSLMRISCAVFCLKKQ